MTVDPVGAPGARLVALTLDDGTPVQPDRVSRVGSAYYDLHFGVLDEIGPPHPTDLVLAPGPLGRTLTDYLAARAPMPPPAVGRVRFVDEP
jgi:hypothetical protein